MQFFDNDNWVISSAGGMTGEAYMAESARDKLFIKRNSSPFLASLSAEHIVPKLLWTRRLTNGDVLTAQQWLNGRELNASEMSSKKVATLLKKIHSSDHLLLTFSKLGKKPISPKNILNDLKDKNDQRHTNNSVDTALIFLNQHVNDVNFEQKSVCHSDINHNNWLIDEKGEQLYLVDWDQAVIADPALDVALLLYWYIDENEWSEWLSFYGWSLDHHLRLRMHWYMIAQTIQFMFWHQDHHQTKEALLYEKDLRRLNDYSIVHFS
ncbi:phosphotransferase family protein [Terrilactibacillus laevilacticus]|uniref:Phosphotransferase n=1 Tax=Terrilactibacillus laevilacticus TaxID=1380157 RepID=A0ABW5PSV6_9BACI|nr:phosphotransferase family protein [Terrilactibacillus laevilacticus]